MNVAIENESRSTLVEFIEHAFSDVRNEGGMRIYDAQLADDYGEESERSLACKNFHYERWQEIPNYIIENHSSILSFFDPSGFRFHLPAYMRYTVMFYDRSDSASVDHAIFSLYLYEESPLRERTLERFKSFSKAQSAAIVAFLEFMAGVDRNDICAKEAQQALDHYWAKRIG